MKQTGNHCATILVENKHKLSEFIKNIKQTFTQNLLQYLPTSYSNHWPRRKCSKPTGTWNHLHHCSCTNNLVDLLLSEHFIVCTLPGAFWTRYGCHSIFLYEKCSSALLVVLQHFPQYFPISYIPYFLLEINDIIISTKPYCHSFVWIATILHLEVHKNMLITTCKNQTLGVVSLLCSRRQLHLHLYLLSLLPAQRELQTLWLLQLAVLLEDWRLLEPLVTVVFEARRAFWAHQGRCLLVSTGLFSFASFLGCGVVLGHCMTRCQQLVEQNSWRKNIFPGSAGLSLGQPESIMGPGTRSSVETVWLTDPQLDALGQITYLWQQGGNKETDFPDSFMWGMFLHPPYCVT